MGWAWPICKGLVETHGGRIRAESAGGGRGTWFTFTVPMAEAASGNAGVLDSPRIPATTRHGREPVHILVVDDDLRTLRYGRDALTAAGLRAWSARRNHTWSCSDPMLPRTDGIKLNRHPRRSLRTAVPAKNDRPQEYVTTDQEFPPIDPRFPAISTRRSWT